MLGRGESVNGPVSSKTASFAEALLCSIDALDDADIGVGEGMDMCLANGDEYVGGGAANNAGDSADELRLRFIGGEYDDGVIGVNGMDGDGSGECNKDQSVPIVGPSLVVVSDKSGVND